MSKRAPRSTKPGPQARILEMLSERRVCLTLDELSEALPDIERKKITSSICRLVTQHYVKREEVGCYQATKEGREVHKKGYRPGPQRPLTAPRKPRNTLRSRVWQVMNARRRFTIPDLLELASTGSEKDAYGNVQVYLWALAKAGYVRELAHRAEGTAAESNGYKQWLLLKQTGVVAPVVRASSIYDPNTREEIAIGKGGAA